MKRRNDEEKKSRKLLRKIKNIIAVMGIITGMVCSGLFVNAQENRGNTAYGEKGILDILSSPFGAEEEKIIGTDNRELVANTEIAPYRYIGLLVTKYESGEVVNGTGFLVGESTLLTAAHCVYKPGDEVKSIIFYPGQNGTEKPFGKYTVSNVHVPTKYKQAAKAENVTMVEKYDYALLELSKKAGNKLGYFKLGGYKTEYNINNLTNKTMVLTGYPGHMGKVQYKHRAKIKGFNEDGYLIYYTMDATDGQSGSPIYKYMDGDFYVVGIHRGEKTGKNMNQGRYITKNVYELVEKYN